MLYEGLRPRLILEGVRGLESQARLTLGEVSRSPAAPSARRAFPVYEWSRLEVQLYLRWKGFELNPLYDEGLTRIGCIVCPAMHLYELWEVAARLYPAVVEAVLERFAALIDPRLVRDGSWRYARG
jgi:3'-phosphoadenosine 5'-phosphosulfate sulfotransferase (PAPS reductase)/FAD synthetase